MSEKVELSEKKIDDEEETTETRTLRTFFKKRWQIMIKLIQLLLCVLCTGLVMEPAKRGILMTAHLDHIIVIFTTCVGYTLITAIFILARAIGDRLPYRTVFIFSMLASGLFCLSGILLAIDRQRRYFYDEVYFEPRPYLLHLMVASSGFSFLSSLVFAVEVVFINPTMKTKHKILTAVVHKKILK